MVGRRTVALKALMRVWRRDSPRLLPSSKARNRASVRLLLMSSAARCHSAAARFDSSAGRKRPLPSRIFGVAARSMLCAMFFALFSISAALDSRPSFRPSPACSPISMNLREGERIIHSRRRALSTSPPIFFTVSTTSAALARTPSIKPWIKSRPACVHLLNCPRTNCRASSNFWPMPSAPFRPAVMPSLSRCTRAAPAAFQRSHMAEISSGKRESACTTSKTAPPMASPTLSSPM